MIVEPLVAFSVSAIAHSAGSKPVVSAGVPIPFDRQENRVPPITITIPGVPKPQGSKTRTRYGMREANPRTLPWRAAVAAHARIVMRDQAPITTPVHVVARFTFPRPKSHYRTGKHAHELRPDAPSWCSTTPDLDKLCRAILDSLSGIILRDDSLVVKLDATKVYGHPAGCELVITEAA